MNVDCEIVTKRQPHFWIVKEEGEYYVLPTLSLRRKDSITKYLSSWPYIPRTRADWKDMQKRGVVACVKVRLDELP